MQARQAENQQIQDEPQVSRSERTEVATQITEITEVTGEKLPVGLIIAGFTKSGHYTLLHRFGAGITGVA